MFHNLQNYSSHLIFQEVERYGFKINLTPKTIKKYMSFTIEQSKKKSIKPGLPIVFVDSVHFLNNSLDNLVKNLRENNFYHLSNDFNTNELDLVQKKGFFPNEYWHSFKNFREGLLAKISFIIHWLIVKLVIKIMNMFLTFGKLLN